MRAAQHHSEVMVGGVGGRRHFTETLGWFQSTCCVLAQAVEHLLSERAVAEKRWESSWYDDLCQTAVQAARASHAATTTTAPCVTSAALLTPRPFVWTPCVRAGRCNKRLQGTRVRRILPVSSRCCSFRLSVTHTCAVPHSAGAIWGGWAKEVSCLFVKIHKEVSQQRTLIEYGYFSQTNSETAEEK